MELDNAFLKKKEIVDHIVKLMDEEGMKNISVKEICEHANIALGTFYHYFQSKNSIVEEMYKLMDEHYLFYKDQISSHASLEEDIIDFVDHFENFVADWGYYANILIVKTALEESDKHDKRAIVQVLKEIVEKGKAEKSYSVDIKTEDLVEKIFIIIRGELYFWAKADKDYEIRNKISSHVELYLLGLQVKGTD